MWGAIAVIGLLALAGAAGALGGSRAQPPASLYERALSVAGQYRCPVCQGETVAASDAPEAVEIKSLIRGWLSAGRSQSQIRSYLIGRYGGSVLEKPPAAGIGLLLWVLPAGAVAAAVAGLLFAFARWRRAAAQGRAPPALQLAEVGTEPRAGPAAQDQLAGSAETGLPAGMARERSQRLTTEPQAALPLGLETAPPAGLETAPPLGLETAPPAGLETAPPAGPETARPAGPLTELAATHGKPPGRRAVSWSRRATLVGGLSLILLAGALWLVDRASAPRVAGATITGNTGTADELAQAVALTASDPVTALQLYKEVLATVPDQVVALTGEGWIYAEAGFAQKGIALLTEAEGYDPAYAPSHLYRGIALLEYGHEPRPAATELEWYLAHDPAKSLEATARQALQLARSQLTAPGSH